MTLQDFQKFISSPIFKTTDQEKKENLRGLGEINDGWEYKSSFSAFNTANNALQLTEMHHTGHYRLQNKNGRHNVDDFWQATHNSNDKQQTCHKSKQEHELALVMMVILMESPKLQSLQ